MKNEVVKEKRKLLITQQNICVRGCVCICARAFVHLITYICLFKLHIFLFKHIGKIIYPNNYFKVSKSLKPVSQLAYCIKILYKFIFHIPLKKRKGKEKNCEILLGTT